MSIRRLPETVVNRIAAGEVVERPASVVKELVENAIDADARSIEIVTAGGGLSLLRITDDGSGMDGDELALAISRHCTSKLGDDIFDIRALGFRGEALPSIGSVARLTLRSRKRGSGSGDGAQIEVEAGQAGAVRPAAVNAGTVVEVHDLFFATPARLKFMKSVQAENGAIADVVRRIALAFPTIRFRLSGPDRASLDFPAQAPGREGALARIRDVIGEEFAENCLPIEAERERIGLTGFISIPSYNRGNAAHQYLAVNGRPIRDRQLTGAVRGAYADALPKDRHGLVALFLDLDPRQVDVNVHPAKADVRFRDPALVRGLIVGSIRQALAGAELRSATDAASRLASAFAAPEKTAPMPAWRAPSHRGAPNADWSAGRSPFAPAGFGEETQTRFDSVGPSARTEAPADIAPPPQAGADGHRLGAARAQIHENYIVAQTDDSLVIVDQHAAHERLVYEALKSALEGRSMASQGLLIPEIVDMPTDDVDRLAAQTELFSQFGLVIERFGPGAIAVQATPAMLGAIDAAALIADLADELAETDRSDLLQRKLHAVAATMACHGSVRSGRRLVGEEMNALLRQMEANPASGTCNHGRPTYIELKLSDIEKLFERR